MKHLVIGCAKGKPPAVLYAGDDGDAASKALSLGDFDAVEQYRLGAPLKRRRAEAAAKPAQKDEAPKPAAKPAQKR